MKLENNVVMVILVIAFLAIGSYLVVNLDTNTQTVSVSGISEITSEPDLVVIYLSIETLENSAQAAEDKNSEISDNVMNELRKLGLENDAESISFNLYPEYEWTRDSQNFKGYKAIHQIKVNLEEVNFAGTIIDKTVEQGALINSIQFELTQEHENELKAEVLELATKDAKTKAEAIATGSGGKLGKLVSVSANDYYYGPYLAYEKADSATGSAEEAKSAVLQISTSKVTVNANVQAVYKIR